MLGHVIGIPVHHTRGLPAQEAPSGIGSFAFDAVQIHAPARARFDGIRADRRERDAGGGVPDVGLLVDTCSRLPAGAPVPVVALAAEVNGEVDPVAGRRDFEFAVFSYFAPVGSQEELDYIAIPQLIARPIVLRRLPDVQLLVGADE